MQSSVPDGDWSMAAIIGLEDEKVDKACKLAQEAGFVVPANYICPGQVAISGEKQAVAFAMEKAKELGAKRAIELKTSGPFHTEKLIEASKKLKEELEKIQINEEINKHIIKNIDATEYTNQDNIKEILAKHVISPVKFSKSIQYMIDQGVDTFIEVGPGKVLSGFIKKINKDVTIMNIQDVDTLENVINNVG